MNCLTFKDKLSQYKIFNYHLQSLLLEVIDLSLHIGIDSSEWCSFVHRRRWRQKPHKRIQKMSIWNVLNKHCSECANVCGGFIQLHISSRPNWNIHKVCDDASHLILSSCDVSFYMRRMNAAIHLYSRVKKRGERTNWEQWKQRTIQNNSESTANAYVCIRLTVRIDRRTNTYM